MINSPTIQALAMGPNSSKIAPRVLNKARRGYQRIGGESDQRAATPPPPTNNLNDLQGEHRILVWSCKCRERFPRFAGEPSAQCPNCRRTVTGQKRRLRFKFEHWKTAANFEDNFLSRRPPANVLDVQPSHETEEEAEEEEEVEEEAEAETEEEREAEPEASGSAAAQQTSSRRR